MADTLRYAASEAGLPCSPFTKAAAIFEASRGSSLYVSDCLPQRGSLFRDGGAAGGKLSSYCHAHAGAEGQPRAGAECAALVLPTAVRPATHRTIAGCGPKQWEKAGARPARTSLLLKARIVSPISLAACAVVGQRWSASGRSAGYCSSSRHRQVIGRSMAGVVLVAKWARPACCTSASSQDAPHAIGEGY